MIVKALCKYVIQPISSRPLALPSVIHTNHGTIMFYEIDSFKTESPIYMAAQRPVKEAP